MASVKTLLRLGICLSAWRIITADENLYPKAENVRWMSVDFTTSLTWTAKPSEYTYTVLFTLKGGDWEEIPDCSQIQLSECDLTNHLTPLESNTYSADIRTEVGETDYNSDVESFPHTYSSDFNPYKESNISAVKFTLEAVDDRRIVVNITDPVTGIHRDNKQLSIRDILKKDLKYKISYSKSGSTGKKDMTSDSSIAEVSELDAGQSYCFMVAAFIPSRPKATQQGAWSDQLCTFTHASPKDLSLGAVVVVVFILITVLIIIVTVTVLCCRCRRQRNTALQIPQSSVAI